MQKNLFSSIRKHLAFTLFLLIIIILSLITFLPFLYPWLFYNPPEKNEIVIIGLEGASWRVINSLTYKDKLPNFKFLIENGAYGIVNSSTLSHDVWNVIANDRLNKSFWYVLAENNKTFISLYWPNSTYNETKIYDLKGSFLFNPLSEFFKKLYYLKITVPLNKADKDLVYDFYLSDKKLREFFYSREELKPDVSAVVLSELPRIQLYYWAYMEPERFQNLSKEDVERYRNVIEEYYEGIDSYLGKLLEEKNTTIILISGYGFDATIPQKIVDKILVNKILHIGDLLNFDYRGEIDFSRTKAYSLGEGLEDTATVYINSNNKEEVEKIKNQVFSLFSNVYVKETGKPVFKVLKEDEHIILQRNVPLQLTNLHITILGKEYSIKDFVFSRIISGRTTQEGVLITYGKGIKKGRVFNLTASDIALLILNLSQD